MKKIFLILFSIFIISPSFALVEEKKISLKEAIDYASSTNPQLKIAKLGVNQAENEIKIADRLQNPSVSIFQNIGSAGYGNTQQIGADYVVEVLKRGKRKNLAKTNLSVVQSDEKFLEQNLILEVKQTYFNLLLKKTNSSIIKEQMEVSKEILESTKESFSKNELPKTDVIQAKIAYDRARMYYNIAKSEEVVARNSFNTIMNSDNIDYDTLENVLNDDYTLFLTINPKDKFNDFEKIKSFALSNRYDLKKAKDEVKSAEDKLKVVKSNLIPDLELSGGYAYITKGMSDTGAFKSGAYAQAGITNIPLIYKYKPEIENAKLEIEKSKLKYEDIKIDIIRNVTDAWEKFNIARNNLNFYNDEMLVNSKELLEDSIKNYNNKKIDLTSFLVSKKLYLELMLGYQQALCEYYISFAELLKELNVKDYSEFI